MNTKIKYWLRWVAVLPGAFIAGLLITLPLHLLLYMAFAYNGMLFGIIELPPRADIGIEYTIYPFFIAVAFILAGYKIAPKYKFRTAIVLFGIYTILWLVVSLMSLFGGNIYGFNAQFSGRTVLAFLGAILGLYLARQDAKKNN